MAHREGEFQPLRRGCERVQYDGADHLRVCRAGYERQLRLLQEKLQLPLPQMLLHIHRQLRTLHQRVCIAQVLFQVRHLLSLPSLVLLVSCALQFDRDREQTGCDRVRFLDLHLCADLGGDSQSFLCAERLHLQEDFHLQGPWQELIYRRHCGQRIQYGRHD
ncbi:unannotated protein [freshwater metagenome]|uniref:Unannotated protein n=1 Tax=freshwater metagenome TaxID=449393 RepID=A0A6J6ZNZ4_9ZZZZ